MSDADKPLNKKDPFKISHSVQKMLTKDQCA